MVKWLDGGYMGVQLIGYGSLMNPESFNHTLKQSDEKREVFYLPARMKSIIEFEGNQYSVRRMFNHPRTARLLTNEDLENDFRAVLDLEVREIERHESTEEWMNVLIGTNISSSQLDDLRERERGYDLCQVSKEHIYYPYRDAAAKYIYQIAISDKDFRRRVMEEFNLEEIEVKPKLLNHLKEIPKSEFEKLVRSTLEEKVYIFAALPRDKVSVDLLDDIINYGKEYLSQEEDIHQIFLDLYNSGKKISRKIYDQHPLINQDLVDIITETFRNYDESNGSELIESVKDHGILKTNFAEILSVKAERELFIIYHLLSLILEKDTTFVLKKLLSKYNIKLLPVRSYNEELIFHGIFDQWGWRYAKDYLNSTYLDDGRLMSNVQDVSYIQNMIDIINNIDYKYFKHNLRQVKLDWFFVRLLRKRLHPGDFVEKMLQKNLIRGYGKYSQTRSDTTGNFTEVVIAPNVGIEQNFRLTKMLENRLDVFFDIATPRVHRDDISAFFSIGEYRIRAYPDIPDFGDYIELKCDISGWVLNNGIISFTLEIKQLKELLEDSPLSFIMTFWTKDAEVEYFSVIPEDKMRELEAENAEWEDITHTNQVPSLSMFLQGFIDQFRNNYWGEEIEFDYRYNSGFNHPLIHSAIPTDLLKGVDVNSDKVVNGVIRENLSEQTLHLIQKHDANQRFDERLLKDLSPYVDLYLFTDFQSIAYYPDPKFDIFSQEKKKLVIFFQYILITRVIGIIIDHELNWIPKENKGSVILDKLNELLKHWFLDESFTRPSRLWRNKMEVDFSNELFEKFSVHRYLDSFKSRSSDIKEYYDQQRNQAQDAAIQLINILLAGSLAFELTSNVIIPFIGDHYLNPLLHIAVWGVLGLVIYLVVKYLPNALFEFED